MRNADDPDFVPCECQYHPVAIEQLSDALLNVQKWPGPICGHCWAGSCACGYAFDDPADAAARAPTTGRLVCSSCAPAPPVANETR